MSNKSVDLTRRTYSVPNSNICFSTRDAVIKYYHIKWGINENELKTVNIGERPNSLHETGCEVFEYSSNGNTGKYFAKVTVSTEDEIRKCMDRSWLE